MKRLRLLSALLWAWTPASAAVLADARLSVPTMPVFAAPVAVPALGACALAPAFAAAPGLSGAASAAPVAATANGLVRAPDVDAGLAALRRASYPESEEVARLVAAIKEAHPELPISAQNLFLIRDPAMLAQLDIPESAAGAARIVTDGRREAPVVILVAAHGVALDAFVEFAVHEAVHLMDDGILRVGHDQLLKHFFAEGWTQMRAVTLANDALSALGRPLTPGHAYHKEIALVDVFSNRHGTSALDALVREGSDAGLRAALGARWDLAGRLASAPAAREKRLNALIALVNADAVGPEDERALLDYVGL
ncbi:MAG: hypothetical protein HKL90_02100 [Elusimicrobia bacterium]|nr:hypothetical protein [Elusimicrobiota bacterium]